VGGNCSGMSLADGFDDLSAHVSAAMGLFFGHVLGRGHQTAVLRAHAHIRLKGLQVALY
jgi:hypothetical protein